MEQARRLIADAMLGRLAKWLRILGGDARTVVGSTGREPIKNGYAEH
ncbi:MAG: hypothetical protein HY204_04880 [Nitrospirae bacterium]|nr:hypothetical protein [Nitrospirota bacterium]